MNENLITIATQRASVRSPILAERFWSKVEVKERLRCWPWRGRKDINGYGQLRMDGRTIRAPRVAFFLRNGKWPDNACHSCEEPSCCNPDHIFDGTRSDNMQDMVMKNRHNPRTGKRGRRTVLTQDQVVAMRCDYKTGNVSMRALAAKYGCSYKTINDAVKRKSWGHVL